MGRSTKCPGQPFCRRSYLRPCNRCRFCHTGSQAGLENKVRVSLFILSSLLGTSAVSAQSQQVLRGPAPDWVSVSSLMPIPESPSGPFFMRRQDLEIHLSGKGQAQYLGFRVKIFQSNALELGNISIAWNPAAGAPLVHDIKVFREGSVIDVLQKSSFEILRREDKLEAARLDGTLTAVLRIPDLRVGDELEVDYTVFDNDPTLGPRHTGALAFAPSPSPGRYHIGLSWDQGHEPRIKPTADLAASMIKGERNVDFRLDNPAVMSVPKDVPARYQWQRAVEYSDFADWASVSRHFAPLFTKASALSANSPVKTEAARIAAAHALPLDRASAALKLVQQDVRYIYVGLNGGNLTPASADETWQRRYGDCKGKTALLLALLGELGIDSKPVLVNSTGTDDGLNQRLPIPELFDHVLVRAHINDKYYWLDGTLPSVASPSPEPVFPISSYLPLTNRGSDLESLEWHPPTTPDEITMYEIDARAGFDKPARIVSTEILRGVEGLKKQMQFSSVSSGQLLDAFRQNGIGGIWQSIDDVQWHYDQKARASILRISGSGTMDWDNDGNGKRSLALPGGGFSAPERRARSLDANQGLPFYTKPEYTCYVTTVRLPTSTQDRQWSSKPSFNTHIFGRNYYRAWELRDSTIRMIRGSRIEQPEITYATAQRDNNRIATFDNTMGYIDYNPAGQKSAVGNGEKVPATYDFDWTADEVPCVAGKPN